MQPIRHQKDKHVIRDPFNDRDIDQQEVETEHVVSDDGGLDSAGLQRHFACGCGCVGAPGGICAECGCLSCSNCFSRCGCGKPLCPRHRHVVDVPNAGRIIFCKPCYDAWVRSRRWRAVLRLLVSPFMHMEGNDEP